MNLDKTGIYEEWIKEEVEEAREKKAREHTIKVQQEIKKMKETNVHVVRDASVLHCSKGNSDKIYVIQLIRNPINADTEWALEASWGRRGRTLRSQIKYKSDNVVSCKSRMGELEKEKVKKGYADIKDKEYIGPCTMEEFKDFYPLEDRELEERILNDPGDGFIYEDVLVRCINNKGVEDDLQEGMEYLAIEDNEGLYTIENHNGLKVTALKSRFEKAE